MELFGVLLIVAGAVVGMACLGVLRSPGSGSSGTNQLVGELARHVMETNRAYPVRDVAIRQTPYGPEVQMSYPLNNMDPEPYGGMMGEALNAELGRMGGQGPGPNHPG